MTVVERIKMLRESFEMSQDELAKKVGLQSATAVCHYENNKRRIPHNIFVRLSDLFGVTQNY